MFNRATQCIRGVLDPPVSVFSLSLYRHPFLYTLFSSHFTLIINNNYHKIRKYRDDCNNNPPSSVSFMSSIDGTSGRLHSEFVRLSGRSTSPVHHSLGVKRQGNRDTKMSREQKTSGNLKILKIL
jgi:hypothetical protein